MTLIPIAIFVSLLFIKAFSLACIALYICNT